MSKTLYVSTQIVIKISSSIESLQFKISKKLNKLSNEYYSVFRYKGYLEMMSKGVLQPEMPPTNRAAFFHGLRTHHQIVIWKMLNDKDVILNPKDWGWFVSEDAISPIKTDNCVAPKSILKVVRCTCKSSTNQCGSNRCSCRKNGLKCMSTCEECRGEDCQNKEVLKVD